MKPRLVVTLSCLCLFFTAAHAKDPAIPTAAPDATKKKVIEKGMSGEEIAQLFGQPAEIKPMKVDDPTTKAEQWLYRRKLKETTSSAAIAPNTPGGMASQMPTDAGNAAYQVHVPVAQYRLQRVTIYQVTALLMVNGRLEVAKQWTERTEAFD